MRSDFGIPECLYISEILRPASGSFVAEERISSDEEERLRSQGTELPACPHIIPGHAVNLAHDVNLYRRDAHLDHLLPARDVRGGQG